jgi:hypothetical protein
MIQQYIFQQMHKLIFIYDKLGLHVSAYQAIIRAPITKNTSCILGAVSYWCPDDGLIGRNM